MINENGNILFGPGEGLKQYKKMTESEIAIFRTALVNKTIKCSICRTVLTIAAFGSNIEDGGSFKRHPYLRAKNSHTPGFSCAEANRESKIPIDISSYEEQESIDNAFQRLLINEKKVIEGVETNIEGGLPSKIYRTGLGEESTSRRISNVISFPSDINKVKQDKKYSFVGNFYVDIKGKSESGITSIYLRSEKFGSKFNFKLIVSSDLYKTLNGNHELWHGKKIKIASAFFLDRGIRRNPDESIKYITYFPSTTYHLRIQMV